MTVLKPVISGQRLLGVLAFLLLAFSILFGTHPRRELSLSTEGAVTSLLPKRPVSADELNSFDCVRSEHAVSLSKIVESDDNVYLIRLEALVVSPRFTLSKRRQGDTESFYNYDTLSRAPKRSPTHG